ncbi:MAG TPA: DinB family protein [Vicinamibacterales bacterium]|nr:DinB family protein [Vicinamibacterales bacterium]
MTADQAKFLAQVIGQQLQAEWMTTYKVLNAIPDDKKDYKPEANSRSAWELAHHIATTDVGFLNAVNHNDFGQFGVTTDATTIPALAEWYKREFPKALERMLALDGSHLSQTVEAWGVMKLPSVHYALFCNNHMIHHRGQLAAYLRPMGGKCPSIYGGSFDEKFQG